MKEVHRRARKSSIVALHNFLSRSKKPKRIYAFVEGKEDQSFYRNHIVNVLAPCWDVELFDCGGKDGVISIRSSLEKRAEKGAQGAFVIYFIDRDLSVFIDESLPNSNDVYITDKYSIENHILEESMLKNALEDLAHFQSPNEGVENTIVDLFKGELKKFRQALVPVMHWIIYWKKNGRKPCLDDIRMKHLFNVRDGIITINSRPKGCDNWVEYIHKQCNIELNWDADLRAIEEAFRRSNGEEKFIRGKYELWFFVKFFTSIVRTYNAGVHIELGETNAMLIVGPKVRCPESLKEFLVNTVGQHISNTEAAA